MASLASQVSAVLLPRDFHRRSCGRLCTALRPAPRGTLSVSWVRADGAAGGEPGSPEVGVFGAFRAADDRWVVALVTADDRWFHADYTDTRLLRQRRGAAPDPLRSVLVAEVIVLQ